MKLHLPLLGLVLLAGCAPGDKANTAAVSPGSSSPSHAKGAEPLRVAHGAEIKLTDYLVPGKTTIFDFTSEYCPPCRAYDEPLAKLHQQRADLVVVKVDINRAGVRKIDWQSPVARQYGMNGIPHFKVYGPDGKLIAEDTTRPGPARLMVNRWLEELK